MKPSGKGMGRLLAESSAIFFSVLLAFAAEQWRTDLNDQKRAKATLALVRAELEQNLSELQTAAPTRDGSVEYYIGALNALVDKGQFTDSLEYPIFPEITTIAYQLATDTGAVTEVAPTDVLTIARAYEALKLVQGNQDFLDRRNAQVRYNDAEQYISGFIYYANRAQYNEPAAVESVEKAIKALDHYGIASSGEEQATD